MKIFFFKNFSKVWSGNNKVPHIWTKIGNFFGYRSAKSCSTAGWEGFGKTQLFLFHKILNLLQNWWIFLRISADILSFLLSVYSMCEIRRPYYNRIRWLVRLWSSLLPTWTRSSFSHTTVKQQYNVTKISHLDGV